jgi:signal transduction histidine kinase
MASHNGLFDIQELIGAVAERHGILLKPDDAAFALVTMNQLVLETAINELVAKLEGAAAEFAKATERVQGRAGSVIGHEVKNALASIRGELQSDIAAAGIQARELVLSVHKADSRTLAAKWISLGISCGLVLFLCGVLIGRMLN